MFSTLSKLGKLLIISLHIIDYFRRQLCDVRELMCEDVAHAQMQQEK
jgi:hypothetical protein